jgi:hypothetical protein
MSDAKNRTKITEDFLTDAPPPEELLDEDNLSKSVVDLSLTLNTRIKALNMYYAQEGVDNTVELITKLAMMYQFSGTKTLRLYLFELCKQSNIDPFLKSMAAKGLCSHDRNDIWGYQAVDIVYPQLSADVGTPYKIGMVKMLMNSPSFKKRARDYFCHITNDKNIDCDYRYKAILGLEEKETKDREEVEKRSKETEEEKKERQENIKRSKYFIQEACLAFLDTDHNQTVYRILAGQYLLQKCNIDGDIKIHVEEKLLGFAGDNDLDYDLRADAADVLLQLGNDENKAAARDIIMLLGRNDRVVRTIFDNAQNVHTDSVEKGVEEAIEFLSSFEIMKHRGIPITFEYVDQKIKDLIKVERKDLEPNEEYERGDKIVVALNRIYMDRALHSRFNCSLSNILLRVWTYINGHEHEDEMIQRLLEELEEMSGTCSSGFASRLVNSISAFGDFTMRISWREQIVANLSGRLNARARAIDDLNFQEQVLNEMIIESDNYEERKHFLRFFRRSILGIREEMWGEFREHISDQDFDLYFRAAISTYETGRFT